MKTLHSKVVTRQNSSEALNHTYRTDDKMKSKMISLKGSVKSIKLRKGSEAARSNSRSPRNQKLAKSKPKNTAAFDTDLERSKVSQAVPVLSFGDEEQIRIMEERLQKERKEQAKMITHLINNGQKFDMSKITDLKLLIEINNELCDDLAGTNLDQQKTLGSLMTSLDAAPLLKGRAAEVVERIVNEQKKAIDRINAGVSKQSFYNYNELVDAYGASEKELLLAFADKQKNLVLNIVRRVQNFKPGTSSQSTATTVASKDIDKILSNKEFIAAKDLCREQRVTIRKLTYETDRQARELSKSMANNTFLENELKTLDQKMAHLINDQMKMSDMNKNLNIKSQIDQMAASQKTANNFTLKKELDEAKRSVIVLGGEKAKLCTNMQRLIKRIKKDEEASLPSEEKEVIAMFMSLIGDILQEFVFSNKDKMRLNRIHRETQTDEVEPKVVVKNIFKEIIKVVPVGSLEAISNHDLERPAYLDEIAAEFRKHEKALKSDSPKSPKKVGRLKAVSKAVAFTGRSKFINKPESPKKSIVSNTPASRPVKSKADNTPASIQEKAVPTLTSITDHYEAAVKEGKNKQMKGFTNEMMNVAQETVRSPKAAIVSNEFSQVDFDETPRLQFSRMPQNFEITANPVRATLSQVTLQPLSYNGHSQDDSNHPTEREYTESKDMIDTSCQYEFKPDMSNKQVQVNPQVLKKPVISKLSRGTQVDHDYLKDLMSLKGTEESTVPSTNRQGIISIQRDEDPVPVLSLYRTTNLSIAPKVKSKPLTPLENETEKAKKKLFDNIIEQASFYRTAKAPARRAPIKKLIDRRQSLSSRQSIAGIPITSTTTSANVPSNMNLFGPGADPNNVTYLQSLFTCVHHPPALETELLSMRETKLIFQRRDFEAFSQSVKKFARDHKGCGENCPHLARFYRKLKDEKNHFRTTSMGKIEIGIDNVKDSDLLPRHRTVYHKGVNKMVFL